MPRNEGSAEAEDIDDPVGDEEILQRGVRSSWVDEHGFPTVAAFPVADLKDPARRGISVRRTSLVGDSRIGGPLSRWPRHVEAAAGHVRAVRGVDGRQVFEIHAAPTDDDRWHALVRFKDPSDPPASARLERDKLLEVFREPRLVHHCGQSHRSTSAANSSRKSEP